MIFVVFKKLRTFALTMTEIKRSTSRFSSQAKVAQLVEHDLAKVGVASSNLVFRSQEPLKKRAFLFLGLFYAQTTHHITSIPIEEAGMVELVDTQDLKSCVH